MELLIVPVPLFNKNIAVEAYYFRYQKGNDLLMANHTTSIYDGAMRSPILETLNTVGLEAFTMGKPIFVPINNLMLLVDIDQQCNQPPNKIIFLLEGDVKAEEPYIANMKRLRDMGYRFAFQKISNIDYYAPLLQYCDYIFINQKTSRQPEQIELMNNLRRNFKYLAIVLTHIDTMEIFGTVQGYAMYEGRFYRTPLTKGENKVNPLQANLIKLLNLVRDENFEFDSVVKIIQRDTALTISLMRLVNSPFIGLSQKVKTINHAVTMLGQLEVRKWVTTAVSKLLGTDKPDEITKLSLVRAKFAENLSVKFEMGVNSQSIFLMGLFSVLDVVLEMPMEEALKMVRVSDQIRDALVGHKGEYYPIYQFIMNYETADWQSVSRMLILYDLAPEDIYEAYIDAACWYRDLLTDENQSASKGKSGRGERESARR